MEKAEIENLTDARLQELYYYKKYSRLLQLSIFHGSHLEWFDRLSFKEKKGLIESLKKMPKNNILSPLRYMPLEREYLEYQENYRRSLKEQEHIDIQIALEIFNVNAIDEIAEKMQELSLEDIQKNFDLYVKWLDDNANKTNIKELLPKSLKNAVLAKDAHKFMPQPNIYKRILNFFKIRLMHK